MKACLAELLAILQGEVVSLRLPENLDLDKTGLRQVALLQFDEGGQKTLAGLINWLGLLAIMDKFEDEDFRAPGVQTLINSLLNIATIFKAGGHEDPVDSMIGRVVKQNQDAKVQPISSFQWAVLLQKMFEAGSPGDPKLTMETALQRYNTHPAVMAQGGKMTAPRT